MDKIAKPAVRSVGTCKRSKVRFASDVHCSGVVQPFPDYIAMSRNGHSHTEPDSGSEHYVIMASPYSSHGNALDSKPHGHHGNKYSTAQPMRSSLKPPRDQTTSMLKGKAILRLSVYINSGMVTVHVIQCRHLQSDQGEPCNSYVKVALMPDVTTTSTCQTDIAHDTNHPNFNEKFSFELLQEDLSKRLCISVWNTSRSSADEAEFLGAMSFGVGHIFTQKRRVNGWYYFLEKDIATRKHVQAIARRSDSEGTHSSDATSPPGVTEQPDCSTPCRDHGPRGHVSSRRTRRGSRRTLGLHNWAKVSENHTDNPRAHRDNACPHTSTLDQIEEVSRNIARDLDISDKCATTERQKGMEAKPAAALKSNGPQKTSPKNVHDWKPSCPQGGGNGHFEDFTASGVIGRAIRQCVTEAMLPTGRDVSETQTPTNNNVTDLFGSSQQPIELPATSPQSQGVYQQNRRQYIAPVPLKVVPFSSVHRSRDSYADNIARTSDKFNFWGPKLKVGWPHQNVDEYDVKENVHRTLKCQRSGSDKENKAIPNRKRKSDILNNSIPFKSASFQENETKRRKLDPTNCFDPITRLSYIPASSQRVKPNTRKPFSGWKLKSRKIHSQSSIDGAADLQNDSSITNIVDRVKGFKFRIARSLSFKKKNNGHYV